MTAQAGDQNGDGGNSSTGSQSGDDAKFTQTQLNSYLAEERRRTEARFSGFDDIKAKADQFDQLTESTKTEVQRANESAADFKARMEAESREKEKVQLENQRYKISAKKGLDPELWDRVAGNTPEEIESDVEKLVAKFGATNRTTATTFRSGASAPPDGATAKSRAAAALRGVRDK